MMQEFREATIEAAVAIRGGSLYEGDEYPNGHQVHRRSWKYLARINELGFLTYISQDAIQHRSGDTLPGERSYVMRQMPRVIAREFVTRFNIATNSMLATLAVPEDISHLRQHSGYLGVTNREVDETTGEWKIRGAMPGVEDARIIEPVNREVYGEDFVVAVQVIDMEWGRRAASKNGLWKFIIKILLLLNWE